MPWEPSDEDCVLCEEPYSAYGGIETSAGWLCYRCAKWVKAVGSELPNLEDGKDWRAEIDSTP
jgi:hypothetical protein